MRYATLIADKTTSGSIRRWVGHTDLDVETILEDAQAHLCRALRVREMREEHTATIPQGSAAAPLPPRFLDPISVHLRNGTQLHQFAADVDLARMRAFRPIESGNALVSVEFPQFYGLWDQHIIVDGRVKNDTLLYMIYNARPEALSASVDTNWLTDRYPHLMRRAILYYAYDFRHDYEKADRQLAVLTDEIRQTMIENELSRRGSTEIHNPTYDTIRGF